MAIQCSSAAVCRPAVSDVNKNRHSTQTSSSSFLHNRKPKKNIISKSSNDLSPGYNSRHHVTAYFIWSLYCRYNIMFYRRRWSATSIVNRYLIYYCRQIRVFSMNAEQAAQSRYNIWIAWLCTKILMGACPAIRFGKFILKNV